MEYNFASRMGGLHASAIREILKFTADPTVISFAAGNPAPEAFPSDAVKEITERILSENPVAALQYSITEGYTPLRETLRSDLKARLRIGREFDELIITSGAQQATEHCCKVLINPGDTILCETPSFVGSLNAFKSYEANLVGVEVEADGISIEKLEKALKENPGAKLLYVIPNFQNPSGATMSLAKRQAVYALCKRHGVLILEDNPYGELRFSGQDIPTIKSMDEDGIVLYCGSFSKVLSPGLRVGYLCAPRDFIQKVVVLKQVSDVHTTILSQMICNEFMTKYDFPAHLNRLREIYRKKSSLMLGRMKEQLAPKITWVEPEGGLFIWCRLPDGVDMMDFCSTAVRRKVAVVPGTAFLPHDGDQTQCFRMNHSTPTDAQIVEGVELLGRLVRELL